MSNWFTPERFNYDYVQSGSPTGATEGEMWYETDTDTAYVYSGTSWIELSVTDHSQLSGVGASDHHTRPTAGAGLAEDTSGNFDVQAGANLSVDANGNLDSTDTQKSTSVVRNDALPFAEGFAPGFTG